MSERSSREHLQPSLLDRLTDDAPQSRVEAPHQQGLTMRQLREAVLRDLAWLLNTSSLATTEDLAAYPLVAKSTINFGVTGFTGLARQSERLARLEDGIREAIIAFEPRLGNETIKVSARAMRTDSFALVFDIEGELWAQPLPVQLFLETAIDLETRAAAVADRGDRG